MCKSAGHIRQAVQNESPVVASAADGRKDYVESPGSQAMCLTATLPNRLRMKPAGGWREKVVMGVSFFFWRKRLRCL